jgi:electron transfer flavoprotein alpha subunit
LDEQKRVGPIWVLVNHSRGQITFVTKEMLQDANEVARSLGVQVWAILINGDNPAEETWDEQVGAFGADHLLRVRAIGIPYLTAEAYSVILEELSGKYEKPYLMIIANSIEGQEIAARLAMKWHTGYANDCVSFSTGIKGNVEATRVSYGEQLETIVAFSKEPAVISFKPGSAGIGVPTKNRKAKEYTHQIDLTSYPFKQKVQGIFPADPRRIDITEADFIVACGHGVGTEDNFLILQELADRLGASVAGTRRANDKGWINIERRVGLTGKTICPQFYLSIGISGAREHVVGMDTSKVVVAINKDSKAEIFRLAHLGIIGDAREVMLALLQKLKEKAA